MLCMEDRLWTVPPPPSDRGGRWKAGGVVLRERRGRIEVLLVTSRSEPDAWILPRGKVSPGEAPEDAAVREIAEEAGVRSSVVLPLETTRGRSRFSAWYLCRFDALVAWPESAERRRCFVRLGDAGSLLAREAQAELLEGLRRDVDDALGFRPAALDRLLARLVGRAPQPTALLPAR